MPQTSLRARVEILEKHVEVLSTLPSRMEAIEVQFVRLRDEVRAGFSAVDRRFEAIDQRLDGLEQQLRQGDEDTRRYMRVLHEEVLARLTLLQEDRPPQP